LELSVIGIRLSFPFIFFNLKYITHELVRQDETGAQAQERQSQLFLIRIEAICIPRYGTKIPNRNTQIILRINRLNNVAQGMQRTVVRCQRASYELGGI
jgi:hypothetical protein